MRELRGKVVVVTGAASGIGEALARGLHAKGAKLALVDVAGDRLSQLAGQLTGPAPLGATPHVTAPLVTTHLADVGDRGRMQELADEFIILSMHVIIVNHINPVEGESRNDLWYK